jgi:hypothetical protein
VCEEQAEKGATISPILIQLLLQKKNQCGSNQALQMIEKPLSSKHLDEASEKNNKAEIIKEIGYST